MQNLQVWLVALRQQLPLRLLLLSCILTAQGVCKFCGGEFQSLCPSIAPASHRIGSEAAAAIQQSPHGPGTELSKLLKRFGVEPTPTCACRAKAAEMDAWGADECSKPERIEEVVGVMREEAKARGLPFIDAVGRMLVKRAIHNARKATIR